MYTVRTSSKPVSLVDLVVNRGLTVRTVTAFCTIKPEDRYKQPATQVCCVEDQEAHTSPWFSFTVAPDEFVELLRRTFSCYPNGAICEFEIADYEDGKWRWKKTHREVISIDGLKKCHYTPITVYSVAEDC